MSDTVLVLAGGVGGAKLALGLAHVLTPNQLVIAVNTADDDEFHGLHVSPDIDTMMYTLSGLSNKSLGWGITGDSQKALSMLARYGSEVWFNLGDKDLGTHIKRTQLLNSGWNLSEITTSLSRSLGVYHSITPMTDDKVRTFLHTNHGVLKFQEYFVQHHHKPKIHKIDYVGASKAKPSALFATALKKAHSIIICPSNPFVSIDPILAIPGMKDGLRQSKIPVVAISPIVGGKAIKGPTAKMMKELNVPSTAVEVARHYHDIITGFVLDEADRSAKSSVQDLGLSTDVRPTVMVSLDDRVALAHAVVEFIEKIS